MNGLLAMEIEVDVVEEMRLRTWARANYVPAPEREESWHPIIHAEMRLRDRELLERRGLNEANPGCGPVRIVD